MISTTKKKKKQKWDKKRKTEKKKQPPETHAGMRRGPGESTSGQTDKAAQSLVQQRTSLSGFRCGLSWSHGRATPAAIIFN